MVVSDLRYVRWQDIAENTLPMPLCAVLRWKVWSNLCFTPFACSAWEQTIRYRFIAVSQEPTVHLNWTLLFLKALKRTEAQKRWNDCVLSNVMFPWLKIYSRSFVGACDFVKFSLNAKDQTYSLSTANGKLITII